MDLFQAVALVGILSAVLSLLAAIVLTRGLHVIGAIAVGLVAGIFGSRYGIERFCTPNGGNLCGLTALLGPGLIAFAAGTLAYSLIRARIARSRAR